MFSMRIPVDATCITDIVYLMRNETVASWPVTILCGMLLAGCQSYPVAMTASGPAQAPTASSSQINEFRAAFELAYMTTTRLTPSISQASSPIGALAPNAAVPAETSIALSASLTTASPANVTGTAAVIANNYYLNAGLALVDTNCLDYFRYEGHLQQNINVFRDLSNSFLPIASGGLALSMASSKAGAIVALVGAANNGVLNAIYKDFLFDANNIDEVQKLVTDALSAHEGQVRSNMSIPGTAINFNWVTNQIMDHQAICQPAHILLLARRAIGSGTVLASNSGAQPGTAQTDVPKVEGQAINGLLPSPPPHVAVTVAPSGNVTAGMAVVQYKASQNQAQFDICLYPTMVSKKPDGTPLDAAGNALLIPKVKRDKFDNYLRSIGYRNGIGAFRDGGGTSQQQIDAFNAVCDN